MLTTTDSNVWGGASGHTYTFARRPDGTTDVDVVVVRDGKNFKGRMVGLVVGLVGKRFLGKQLDEDRRGDRSTQRRDDRDQSDVVSLVATRTC